ncbi:group III truncated hemoglobin [Sinomicrobium weinanense]|uniref:Group III truncated hemoglobin n=1 Tax=Sinomicrobium weinanense TaxID=2842200 RepID=A0A926Q3T8_9FLAO|nr:group III truncated hemoglobin [Sinomicrobium weinanense]MBC9796135.1 group III truncated hemoglobin [Sinomicrobium weinanense]MBU3121886.1 group III truncated hemoglobin [Sinomicrobium weinanense]
MRDIKNREDVFTLVSSFYEAVRKHKEIGPFFNETISDWDEHLEKLTDFWESNLFHRAKYKGNPRDAHIGVDQKSGHAVDIKHFGEWLRLWFTTIDRLFTGELAERAKNNARKMSTHLYLEIYKHRPENTQKH